MIQLSQAEEKILCSLAQYKYLTVSQMTAIGIMKDKRNISKKVKLLRDKGFLKSIAYGFSPGIGRVENVNFLTPKAKKVLLEGLELDASEIRMPIGRTNLFFKDYFHRKYTIDFHIQLVHWTKNHHSSLLLFDTYFDKLGNNRTDKNLRAKTRVDIEQGYLIPDGVFLLEFPDQSKALFLLEVYNGKDTKRVLTQLHKHTQAIELGSVNEKYQYYQGYRILCVFEFASIQEAVMQRMQEDDYFQYMQDHFYFKALDTIQHQTLIENWTDYAGLKQKLI